MSPSRSAGYRVFAFFLEHGGKLFASWIAVILFLTMATGERSIPAWGLVLPVCLAMGMGFVVFSLVLVGGFIARLLR